MYKVGIDIGGTSITVGVVINNIVVETESFKNTFKDKQNELVDILATKINLYKNNYDIKFIGIGCPGRVEDSIVYNAVNLGIKTLELGKEIQAKTSIKTLVENDAIAALIGEIKVGALKGFNNGILLTLGTGVGGGIFIDKKPYVGSTKSAAEFGHVIFERNGKECGCGAKGCFEMYGSTTALLNLVKESKALEESVIFKLVNGNKELIDGRSFFKAVSEKEKFALKILDTYTNYIAEAIVNYNNMLDFEVVAIGGGISEAGELLLKPIEEKVISMGCKAKVTLATLGNAAGVIGAANLDCV